MTNDPRRDRPGDQPGAGTDSDDEGDDKCIRRRECQRRRPGERRRDRGNRKDAGVHQPDASLAVALLRLFRGRAAGMRVRPRGSIRVQPAPRALVEPVDLLQPVGRHGLGVDVAEDLDHLRVELGAGVVAQLVERLLVAQRRAVRTIVDHGVVGVGDGDDPGAERDLRCRAGRAGSRHR